MSTSSKFDERVYPIRGSIRFEVDDIEGLEGDRYSDPVKIGKRNWHLDVGFCKEADQKYLSANLECMTQFDQGETIVLEYSRRLINQKKSGEDVFKRESTKLDEDSNNYYESYKLIEWSKLLSDGFVKDGKIIIVYDIVILSEDVRRRAHHLDRGDRPNEEDLVDIFEVKKKSKTDEFEEEFEVSKISEREVFSDAVAIFGLPVKIGFQKEKKYGKDHMNVYFYLNANDKSDWWRAYVLSTATIVNRTDMTQSFSTPDFQPYMKSNNWARFPSMEWSKLVDPANGFVKDGKFKIRIWIHIFEMLGFDENTGRGIDRPMRRMTDAVLTVGDKKLYVCKKILAHQSSYFKNLFSSNPGKLEFDFKDVQLGSFIKLLELIENADTNVCEENADDVLELIKTYKAPECFERIDSILKNLEFKDTSKVLELVDKYPLPKLRNKFLLKLNDEDLLKSTIHSSRYKNLSDKMKVAILEWKWIPEESRTESAEPTSYQFSTDFDEESDLTDIKINVKNHGYYASKQILANSSHFFMKKFYGPYSEDTSEVTVFYVSPREFEKLLTHIYHPTRPVTSANIDSLLQLAQQFRVPRLMDKCEEYLVISDNILLIDKLQYAGKFELPYLLESCLKFANDPEKVKELKNHYKFQHLSTKVLGELMKRVDL